VAAWQPNAGQALKAVAGSKAIFTSADAKGLIYDVLAVNPASLSAQKDDWAKVVNVWYRIVDYFYDPKTQEDAIAIMASRVNLKPAEYKAFVGGTHILKLDEAKKAYVKADGLGSIHGSSVIVDKFNVDNKVYKESQPVDDYLYPEFTEALK
jgi:NitT/TauT family transport system substrate-binding protein